MMGAMVGYVNWVIVLKLILRNPHIPASQLNPGRAGMGDGRSRVLCHP